MIARLAARPQIGTTGTGNPVSAPALAAASDGTVGESLDGYIARLEEQVSSFDISVARRVTTGVIATGMTLAGVAGQLCHAFLPPPIGIGVAAVISAGIGAASCVGANHAMHYVRDTSAHVAVAALTFFAGFGAAAGMGSNPFVALGATAAVGLAFGALWSRQAQTRHYDIPERIARARHVAERFYVYASQHRALERHLGAG